MCRNEVGRGHGLAMVSMTCWDLQGESTAGGYTIAVILKQCEYFQGTDFREERTDCTSGPLRALYLRIRELGKRGKNTSEEKKLCEREIWGIAKL